MTSSRTNFARLGHVHQDIAPKLWQTILVLYEPNTNLQSDCSRNKFLKNKNGLTPEEWEKVRKAKTDDYKTFDISLLYKLFRNLNFAPNTSVPHFDPPKNGYGHPRGVDPGDTSPGGELERFRIMRNELFHRGSANVSDQEMTENFKQLVEIAVRLEKMYNLHKHGFVTDIKELQTCCMDEETEAEYARKLEVQFQREKALEDRVAVLEGLVSFLI